MPELPTTEGSIVAFLKLDDSDWNEKLDRAEEKARALGRIDPTIHVHADTADALAKIEAVRMAAEENGVSNLTTTVTTVRDVQERTSRETSDRVVRDGNANAVADAEARMQAAMEKARIAAQAEEVAAMRLDDVQRRRGHTVTQVAAAELALERASMRAEAAQAASLEAGQALRDARAGLTVADNAAAAAESDLASAADGAGRGLDKTAGGAGNARGQVGLLAGAIAALIPLAGPLAGFASGVAGGLAGMGAAGVLAVLGIKNEMAAGTVQGQQYSDLMGTLKDDLHSVEDAAASGVLAPFANMVDRVDQSLPQLTGEMGLFARDGGNIAATVVDTLVSGFQILNPLFREGDAYVQHLASDWQHWVTGGGLNQFAADAEQALPIVAADLGNLASIGMKVITGLAPFGTVVLEGLQAVSTVIDMLPTPALIGVGVAAATAYGEFRMWSRIVPIITTVERALGMLAATEDATLGPIGLVLGAVTALGVGFAAAAVSTQQASQDTQDYTLMLEQTNGVIDESIRKQTMQKLVSKGLADEASHYGISLSQLTTAVTDGGPALDALNKKFEDNYTQLVQVRDGTGQVIGTQRAFTGDALKTMDAIDGESKSFAKGAQNARDIASATAGAASAQGTLAQYAKLVSDALATQTTYALNLTNAFNLLNGVNLNNVQTLTAQRSAINSVTSSFKTNGAAIDGASNAAVANQQAVEAAVSAIEAHAEAAATSAASTAKNMTETQKKTLADRVGIQVTEQGRQALLDQLRAQGDLTPAVQSFIDTVLKIPTKRNVTITANTIQADNALMTTAQLIDSLQSRNIVQTITTNEVRHTFGVGDLGAAPGHAFGGTIGGTASGPGTNMSDSILTRLSRGEEVVSDAHGQASQFRGVLKAINAGASVPQVQALIGAPSGQPQTVNHNHYGPFYIKTNNPEQFQQLFNSWTNGAVI